MTNKSGSSERHFCNAGAQPALSNTRWETWLQTAKQDGFFEVWSGTPAQLLTLAAEAKKQ